MVIELPFNLTRLSCKSRYRSFSSAVVVSLNGDRGQSGVDETTLDFGAGTKVPVN